MKTMCPPGYHHNGFVATHAKLVKPIWVWVAHVCSLFFKTSKQCFSK